jgi:nitrogen fixation protein FixH
MTAHANLHPRDRWIPWYFVAFFIVLFIVNAVFVYLATSTNPGVIADKAYIEGKDYNQTIAMAARQASLGWKAEASLKDNEIIFTLSDRNGAPLNGAIVSVRFRRPAESAHDFTLSLMPRGAGRYAAPLAQPVSGIWDATFFAMRDHQPFQYRERLRIAP